MPRGVSVRAFLRVALRHVHLRPRRCKHRRVADHAILPEALTLEEAYRATFFLADAYIRLQSNPDVGLLVFHQYLRSDPARWDDWKRALPTALRPEVGPDPLADNLLRD